jgi:hypothetical protein
MVVRGRFRHGVQHQRQVRHGARHRTFHPQAIERRQSVAARHNARAGPHPYHTAEAGGDAQRPAKARAIRQPDLVRGYAAAAPPEDPPAVRPRFQGLRVTPQSGLKVWLPANSGTLDLASGIAPLRRSVATVRSSSGAR